MLTALLVLIYLAFISLGLPDSILGCAWPDIHQSLGVSVSSAGIVSMTVSGCTIISSFYSEAIIKKIGTGKIIVVSVGMTAAALLGFSYIASFLWFLPFAVILGLGAGAIDAALNNFVAIHYKARHMNWLHCFWGLGATFGPVIMSFYLRKEGGFRGGFRTISLIQSGLFIILLFSLPLWKRIENRGDRSKTEAGRPVKTRLKKLLEVRGAKEAFFIFFCYCAIETTAGLWGSTYLVVYRGISSSVAAQWISLYYFGITAGRFISGILTAKFNNKQMIFIGQIILGMGILCILLPFSSLFQLAGFALTGLGCAPIFPSMIHETPRRFGRELSQAFIGIQMSSAYMGSTFMPLFFGFLAEYVSIQLLPYYLGIFFILMCISIKIINGAACKPVNEKCP